MKTAALFLLGCAFAGLCSGEFVYSSPAELARALRERPADASLPDSWTVQAAEKRYVISTFEIRESLKAGDLEDAQARINALARALETYDAAPRDTHASSKATLDAILSRSEFSAVRPPSAWELLMQRVRNWFLDLLRSVLGFVGPSGQTIVYRLAIGLAVAVLFWWLYGAFVRKKIAVPAVPIDIGRAQSWEQWLKAARAAADRGEHREAIHLAYEAAVSRLQHDRLLPRGATKTAREYLRTIPADGNSHASFAALTSSLERFFYGGRDAAREDVDESFSQLKELGCLPE